MFKVRIPLNDLNSFSQISYNDLKNAFDSVLNNMSNDDFAKNNYCLRRFDKEDSKQIVAYDLKINTTIDAGIVIGMYDVSNITAFNIVSKSEDISMLYNIADSSIKQTWNDHFSYNENQYKYGGVFISNSLETVDIEETYGENTERSILCTNDGIVLILTSDMLVLVDILYENIKDKTNLENLNDLSQSFQDASRYERGENLIQRKILSTPRLSAVVSDTELEVLQSIKSTVTKTVGDKSSEITYTMVPLDPGFIFKKQIEEIVDGVTVSFMKFYFNSDFDSLCFYLAENVSMLADNDDDNVKNDVSAPESKNFTIKPQWTELELVDGTVYHVLKVPTNLLIDNPSNPNKILTQVAFEAKFAINERRAFWMNRRVKNPDIENDLVFELSFENKEYNFETDGYVYTLPAPTGNVYELKFQGGDHGDIIPQVVNITTDRLNSFDIEEYPKDIDPNYKPHYNYTKDTYRTVDAIIKLKTALTQNNFPKDAIHVEIY